MKKSKEINETDFPAYKKINKPLIKISENSKEIVEKNEFMNNVKYRPINPKHPFNGSSIGINEILKKNNLSLITNSTLKNIIIKFREERKKENDEKKIFYKNRSIHDYDEEKKNNFLMLKALLKKDPQTIQNLINLNKKKNKRMNKYASSNNISSFKKDKDYPSLSIKFRNNSSLIIPQVKKNFTPSKALNNFSLVNKNTKRELWDKEFFSKCDSNNNIRKKFSKKYELKIKGANSLSIGGKMAPLKVTNFIQKRLNQDICFSLLNINSVKLGEISLFGILDGNGPFGKQISSLVKDYIIDYFTNSSEMIVTLKRDNFYSIMYNSFAFAQNYLINNISKLNINIDYSGVTGCILLYPQNGTNKIYCANLGRNKCLLYTMFGTVRLSYELFPERASEKYRISVLKKKKENLNLANNDGEDSKILNLKKINDNNNINNNFKNENNKEKDNTKSNNPRKSSFLLNEKDKEDYLKDFLELDISRCIGNLAGLDYGIIPGPEVIENDIRISRGKFIVMGTASLWKYLTEEEVGEIVNKYLASSDSAGACKELEEIAKDRWKLYTGGYDDISVVIVFFDLKTLDMSM